ncbi:hypothetical protein Tco_0667486 [Tanacetum coccineum]
MWLCQYSTIYHEKAAIRRGGALLSAFSVGVLALSAYLRYTLTRADTIAHCSEKLQGAQARYQSIIWMRSRGVEYIVSRQREPAGGTAYMR